MSAMSDLGRLASERETADVPHGPTDPTKWGTEALSDPCDDYLGFSVSTTEKPTSCDSYHRTHDRT
jgi:hypothetical protein